MQKLNILFSAVCLLASTSASAEIFDFIKTSEPTNLTYMCENKSGVIAISLKDKKAWQMDSTQSREGIEMQIVDLRQARCAHTYGMTFAMPDLRNENGLASSSGASLNGCGTLGQTITLTVENLGGEAEKFSCRMAD